MTGVQTCALPILADLDYSTGELQRDPVRPQIAPTDHATAYYAYGSVMAALLSRDLNGEGVYIDVAGFDSQVSCESAWASRLS